MHYDRALRRGDVSPRVMVPLAPVLPFVACALASRTRVPEPLPGQPARYVEGVLGVSDRQWHRIVKRGYLSVEDADTLATTLELHPITVWPGWETEYDLCPTYT